MSQSQSLIPTKPDDIMTLAQSLAKSGYFQDARDASQAFVKVLAGAELGIPPFQAMSGIHVISGKPVLGAGLIASLIKRSGKYDYRVTEQSDQLCSIDFYQGADKIGTSLFTLEMAKKAGVKNLDKFAVNMLFARAISNGAKWYTPDIFGGAVYTDGEIEPVYTAPVVEETTAEVLEARPREQPKLSKQELADASAALLKWQNEIDQLPAEAEKWTAHLGALRTLPGIGNNEKKQLFNSLTNLAFEQGMDYDNATKAYYHVESAAATEEVS